MNLTFRTIEMHLKHTFTISRGSTDIARSVIVEIQHDGCVGLGEAVPMGYLGETRGGVKDVLPKMAAHLGDDPFNLQRITGELEAEFPGHPAARAAVGMALRDLCGKLTGMPVWRMLGLDPDRCPLTSFTIGIDTPEVVRAKVEEVADWPILKIKVGVEGDMELVRTLRDVSDATLRVDANMGWTPEEAVERIAELAGYGVEFVEQPIAKGDPEAMRFVKERSALPIIADESCVTARDVPALAGCVDGVNIKLMKCGGIGPALEIIHTARAHGMSIMIGCNIESSVSITAAGHLAPLVDYIDLDGNILTADDPFTGMTVDRGRVSLPTGPGLGVQER